MARQYNMMHRVTYAQIIDVLKEAGEPLWFDELSDALPCEPDAIILQEKLDKMIIKGMIACRKEMRFESVFGAVVEVENRRYSLPDKKKEEIGEK